MDNSLLQILEEIDLSVKEAEIYITLLQIGSNPASTIAKKTNQNRSTCYNSLEKLIQKGFVKQIIIGKINYFSAVEPKYILNQLKNKRYDLEAKIENLSNFLPQFETFKTPLQNKSKVFFYEGQAGIQNILEDTLNAKETIRAYASFEELVDLFPHYLPQYYRKRKQKSLFVRAIYPETERSLQHQKRDHLELRETRLIPQELDLLANTFELGVLFPQQLGELGQERLHHPRGNTYYNLRCCSTG